MIRMMSRFRMPSNCAAFPEEIRRCLGKSKTKNLRIFSAASISLSPSSRRICRGRVTVTWVFSIADSLSFASDFLRPDIGGRPCAPLPPRCHVPERSATRFFDRPGPSDVDLPGLGMRFRRVGGYAGRSPRGASAHVPRNRRRFEHRLTSSIYHLFKIKHFRTIRPLPRPSWYPVRFETPESEPPVSRSPSHRPQPGFPRRSGPFRRTRFFEARRPFSGPLILA